MLSHWIPGDQKALQKLQKKQEKKLVVNLLSVSVGKRTFHTLGENHVVVVSSAYPFHPHHLEWQKMQT